MQQLDVLAWQSRRVAGRWGHAGHVEEEEEVAWEKRGIPPSLFLSLICENLEVVHFPRIFCDEAVELLPKDRSLRHGPRQLPSVSHPCTVHHTGK